MCLLRVYRIRTRHETKPGSGQWVWMSHRITVASSAEAYANAVANHAVRHRVNTSRVELVETLGGERLYPYVF